MSFSWTDETVYSDPDVLTNVAIAVDSLHVPRIINGINAVSGFRYHDRTGGTWATESVGTEKKAGGSTSIAIDSLDQPHVLWARGLGDYDLGYSILSDGTWTNGVADDIYGSGAYNSIAIDESDNIHISYYDELSSRANLRYGYFNSTSWSLVDVDTTGDVGNHNSIALTSGGVPHIAYIDKTNSALKHAWLDETWQTETIDTTIDNQRASIKIADDGTIYIAYHKGFYLKLATYAGSWNIENIDGSVGDAVGWNASLQLDHVGGIHIAYKHSSNNYIKYAYNNGDSWAISTPDGTASNHAGICLVLSDNGYAHIATCKDFGTAPAIHYFTAQVFTPITVRPLWVASPLGTLNRSMKPLGV